MYRSVTFFVLLSCLCAFSCARRVSTKRTTSTTRVLCSTVLTAPSGNILSPNYGKEYPGNLACTWTIKAPVGKKINLYFKDFVVEKSRSCRSDYLLLYDGANNTARLVGRYCSARPPPFTSSSNYVHMEFHSDASLGYRGFFASYNISLPTTGFLTNRTCTSANWWASFNKNGLSKCPVTSPFINGLYRSEASRWNLDYIYLLQEAKCCGNGNSDATCQLVNWVRSFDRNRNWNSCPSGYFLSGLYRSIGHNLHNIEYGWCCKPARAANSYKSCYDEDVSLRFNWNRRGMVSCRRSGYYITGLYRSSCNYLSCIEKFKCCQLPIATAPQTTTKPTAQLTASQTTARPTAQATGATSSNVFQIQSLRYNKCLEARYMRRRVFYNYRYVFRTIVVVSLGNCVGHSKQQSWRWTSDGRLQSDFNQECLAVTGVWGYQGLSYRVSMQPCNSTRSYQKWVCNNLYLKLKNQNLYLEPYLNSRRTIGGVRVRYRATNTFLWSRYGSSKSLCTKASQTTTTISTAQVTALQTTTRPTTKATGATLSNVFQIQSSRYNKCLQASYVRRRVFYNYRFVVRTRIVLSLGNCVVHSKQQSWRWTSDGRLQSDLTQECLAVTSVWTGYLGRRYGVSMQPCNSTSSYQKWVCNGLYLKLKNSKLYLEPFTGGVRVTFTASNNFLWTRYGSSKSLCTNAPQTTAASTAQVTTIVDKNQWFQIKNTDFNKCLALRNKSKLSDAFRGLAATFTLDTCDQNSARQLWKWTSDGQLKLNYNGNCLTFDWYKSIHFQPCKSSNQNQQWSCVGNKLKLKFGRQHLAAFAYSGLPFGFNVKTVWYCTYTSCTWTRSGTAMSICDNAPQTTPASTAQVTTLQTTPASTAQITTVASKSQWFQIKDTGYNKCLSLQDKSKLTPAFRRLATTFTLDTCDQNSRRQSWQWTSDGQLKLNYTGNCLTFDWYKSIHLQPCKSANQNQQWSCVGNKLKLKFGRQHLATFAYTGSPFRFNVKTVWYCTYTRCTWTRFGTAKSICDNGKATTTTSSLTTQMVSTQLSRATSPTTTAATTTTAIPSTTQPPLPPTDDIGTPPLPPTGSLIRPPIPANTPPVPPFPGNTSPVPPFPGNTPPVAATTKPPPPQTNKKIRCGTKGRIGGVVNGTAAAAGSWPWQVGIKKCAHCNITCGGTLINDEWVVTAAHCVSGWFPNELYIVIGEVDQSVKSGHEQRFRCTKIIVHEDYGVDAPYDKDIALIQLDKYAVYNDNVRPLCMPASGTVLTKNDLCTVTGFGRVTQNGVKSAKLLEANVRIVDLNTCAKTYSNLPNPRKVTSNMLCAGYKKGGTDACQGDSGGPLTCFDRSNSRFILGGLVSWGVGCAQPDLYGVYTNTALFTPWVQKKLAAFGY